MDRSVEDAAKQPGVDASQAPHPDVVILAESRIEESARVAERFYFDKNLGAYVGDVPSDR